MAETWRDHCRPIIQNVIAKNVGASEKRLRAELRKAYPYGERSRHPYKIWCDEVNFQIKWKQGYSNKKPVKTHRTQLSLF